MRAEACLQCATATRGCADFCLRVLGNGAARERWVIGLPEGVGIREGGAMERRVAGPPEAY